MQSSSAPVLWLTGLSGAGKSTLAERVVGQLRAEGIPTIQLDGDRLRAGLNQNLGFSSEDRDENIRRCAEVAKLLSEQGCLVVCSLISPMQLQRDAARTIIGPSFVEVYIDCSLETAIERDPKGLYARALRGEIAQFTGVSAPYEAPPHPDLHVRTDHDTIAQSSEAILQFARRRRQSLNSD